MTFDECIAIAAKEIRSGKPIDGISGMLVRLGADPFDANDAVDYALDAELAAVEEPMLKEAE